MEKPISMIIEETKQSLISTLNGYQLHPSILEMIVKDVFTEIVAINNNIKAQEKEVYLKSLQESTEK